MISGITENENNKEKERKHWIPNQVGDDSGCAFEDDKSPLSYLKKRIYKRQRISSSIPGNGN
ncbi:MAG TPA: hypothetical protein PLC43_03540 [Caldisericia bacterium]|nr:hypothetical protein [Caldisericia bacterium]